jgi:uncharacterized protein YlxP (DUF503 family)
MMIGVCQVELLIPESSSLKSKRFILKSLKTRIRNKFNVSIAEIAENEKWQRTVLGMALVSNDRKMIDGVFNQIINLINSDLQVEMIDHFIDIY